MNWTNFVIGATVFIVGCFAIWIVLSIAYTQDDVRLITKDRNVRVRDGLTTFSLVFLIDAIVWRTCYQLSARDELGAVIGTLVTTAVMLVSVFSFVSSWKVRRWTAYKVEFLRSRFERQ